ncbi:hypothetical protein [Bacteroides oleiciplenus]|uniref:Spi protease inhibitor domain-containing protein n=1 Tax=Bacteroides oleiciplenus YIT 12058 TaxID=742727 RepID=K9E6U3_9BACE|nr:hypothetical protein [Bacteroides oleiciplenus]EKU91586.1 hypothetical protein HMPREF9447_01300 [Bacteroides oleiciplenus YIT 12058]
MKYNHFSKALLITAMFQLCLSTSMSARQHLWEVDDNEKPIPVSLSGIYPHLAYYNNEGECGTRAVVPWSGHLWMITYGPHLPVGSSDKLLVMTGVDIKQAILLFQRTKKPPFGQVLSMIYERWENLSVPVVRG